MVTYQNLTNWLPQIPNLIQAQKKIEFFSFELFYFFILYGSEYCADDSVVYTYTYKVYTEQNNFNSIVCCLSVNDEVGPEGVLEIKMLGKTAYQ